MKKYFHFFLSTLLLITTLIQSYNNPLQTSIIIPCDFKHIIHLEKLLHHYTLQTVLPDEIIVAISETNKIPSAFIKKLMDIKWPFPVQYTLTSDRVFAGENRNRACKMANTDIFICQDADDIPHKNRIEVIKYFFYTYPIDHLIHLFKFSKNSDKNNEPISNFDTIQYIYPKSFRETTLVHDNFHNGNIAITKKLFQNIQWTNRPKGQDVEFNEKVYHSKTFSSMGILQSLMTYRIENSSWACERPHFTDI